MDMKEICTCPNRVKIKNVAIIGGTHGNEYTGVYLLKKLSLDSIKEKYGALEIQLILANPKAFEQCVRLIDNDLNRSFLKRDLENAALPGYEAKRAKVINQMIGPKGSPKTDLIIDIHTTTSNTGILLAIFDDCIYNYKLASYIKSKMSNVYIYYVSAESFSGGEELPFLHSISPYGFSLEIGPIPNGIVRHDILEQAENVINLALEFMNLMNAKISPEIDNEIEVFMHKKYMEFPMDDDGNIAAIVHKHIQDKDYRPIKKGDPIFLKLNGEIIRFDEDQVMYPIFINEAAYYSKNIAFFLAEKTNIRIS